ncbi:MAG: glycosyltransferase family 4 protein [Rickettsiaceae bacterium]|nr:glycosyltransferase family 4 protein [Rickettsiaceae bacterium]
MSFLISIVCILATMPILRKCGIVDVPSSRRAHLRPTIRGGGISLVIAFVITLIFISCNSHGRIIPAAIVNPVLMVSVVSFWDDVVGISVVNRLVVHFVSSYLCVSFFISPYLIFRGELHPLLDMTLCVIALVSFINIYNFLDGIDGISAMQSIHLSITAIVLCILRDKVIINVDTVFYVSSILLGCSLGFLLFNWNPAIIFMGDVGSTFLGMLHGLNLLIIASSSERLFLASTIASLYYIADGGLTILIRLMRGEKIWLPHLNHFFQQAARKGMSHAEIVTKISVCNIILLALAVLSIYTPHVAIVLSVITVAYILIHFHGKYLETR